MQVDTVTFCESDLRRLYKRHIQFFSRSSEFLSVSIVQLSKFPLVNCKSAEKLEFQLSGGAAARYIWRATRTSARLRHLCTTSSPLHDFVTGARLRHLCRTSSPLPDFVTFAGLLHRCPTSSPLHDFFTAAEHRPR